VTSALRWFLAYDELPVSTPGIAAPATVAAVAAVALGTGTAQSAATHPAPVDAVADAQVPAAGQIATGVPVLPPTAAAVASVPSGSAVDVDDIVDVATVTAVAAVGATVIHSVWPVTVAASSTGTPAVSKRVARTLAFNAAGTASRASALIPRGGITVPQTSTALGVGSVTVSRRVSRQLSAVAVGTAEVSLTVFTIGAAQYAKADGTLGPLAMALAAPDGTLVPVSVHSANAAGGLD
jgi:hypothetical protein